MQDIKRDRVERQLIKCKYRDMLRGSSHYSTSPPSYRRISTMSTQDLPQRALHRGITTQHLEYITLLSNTITSIQEVRHKPKQRKCLQSPLTHSERTYQNYIPNHHQMNSFFQGKMVKKIFLIFFKFLTETNFRNVIQSICYSLKDTLNI